MKARPARCIISYAGLEKDMYPNPPIMTLVKRHSRMHAFGALTYRYKLSMSLQLVTAS